VRNAPSRIDRSPPAAVGGVRRLAKLSRTPIFHTYARRAATRRRYESTPNEILPRANYFLRTRGGAATLTYLDSCYRIPYLTNLPDLGHYSQLVHTRQKTKRG
jgi:hypothetical protein